MKRRLYCGALGIALALSCLRCGSAGEKTSGGALGNGADNTAGTPASGGSLNLPGGSSAGSNATGNPGTGGAGPGTGGGGAGGAPIIVVPPEQELEASFLAPVVTGKFVFSANPKSGRVAVIDAETYAVKLFNAGFGPKYLAALPDDRGAIVINDLSHDTTLFRLDGEQVSSPALALPVHDGANAWAMSPDGRFAIAWTQADPEQADDPTAGSQTVTVLDLEKETSRALSVGFHPIRVSVDDKSARAFVVNDDGVSVIELGDESQVSLLVPVSEDPLEDSAARDVNILPDGSFAVVRLDDKSELRIVDLSRDDSLASYSLGAPVTDVDVSSDGKLAVAALPGIGQVALVTLPPTGPESFERVAIPGEITSSVALSDDASLALLYQNAATAANSHVTVLDLRPDQKRALRTVDLRGPVKAAFVAPGAASAIVLQRPIAGSTKPGLFSGLPTLARRSAKIVGMDAPPVALSFDQAGEFALVTIAKDMPATQGVYCVRLDTMQEDFLALASPPAPGATGIVEQVKRGFVAQSHPEGRITFIDLETAHAHTITGFELAARIQQ